MRPIRDCRSLFSAFNLTWPARCRTHNGWSRWSHWNQVPHHPCPPRASRHELRRQQRCQEPLRHLRCLYVAALNRQLIHSGTTIWLENNYISWFSWIRLSGDCFDLTFVGIISNLSSSCNSFLFSLLLKPCLLFRHPRSSESSARCCHWRPGHGLRQEGQARAPQEGCDTAH